MSKKDGGGELGLLLLIAGVGYGLYYVASHPLRSAIESGEAARWIPWAVLLVLGVMVPVYLAIAWLGSARRGGGPPCGLAALEALVVAAAVVAALCGYYWHGPVHLRSSKAAYWKSAGRVCEGIGAPEARAFSQTPGVHKVAALEPRATAAWPWTRHIPKEWRAASLEEMELVLCLDAEEKVTVEVCEYSGDRTVHRYQFRRHVVLREAYSGRIVDETVLKGSSPGSCAYVTSDLSDKKGSRVTADMVTGWLEAYVNP